jgi:hypothetical protein
LVSRTPTFADATATSTQLFEPPDDREDFRHCALLNSASMSYLSGSPIAFSRSFMLSRCGNAVSVNVTKARR